MTPDRSDLQPDPRYTSQLPPQLAPLVEPARKVLQELFDERISQAPSPAYRELWVSLRDATHGGKLVRPLLVMIAATGGDLTAHPRRTQQAAFAGAAFELLHSGFLIHDDIMDRDLIRRGTPTVAAHFRTLARSAGSSDCDHQGDATAIIVGDLALTGAYQLLARCEDKTVDLIAVTDQAIRLTAEGQLLDISADTIHHATTGDVLNVAYLKTSAYSFVAPLQCGMIIAEWAQSPTHHVTEGGRKLGIAFQLYDDILGVAGDIEVSGKSKDSDLLGRKHTLITRFAAQHPDWAQIWENLKDGEDQAVLSHAREVLAQTDAIASTSQIAEDLHAQACQDFEAEGVPEAVSERLILLAQWLEGRRK
ncbi:polyprenyl synthetase family protein [Arcanobacterium phocisimile]|uniref:Polyprenyl synthetase family protein n=1 Tax=Arcanobacterium phocisimile TaxID=1302235 RepID=A0ABX7IF43_9ACTO|nr:polyprenyl synthetase family protein [Arcanobacterium phocisimile]QRV01753.1 polyprenyl synthetase family protein [Arcanobacterium phocisimile]